MSVHHPDYDHLKHIAIAFLLLEEGTFLFSVTGNQNHCQQETEAFRSLTLGVNGSPTETC